MDTLAIIGLILGIIGGLPGVYFFLERRRERRISWKATLQYVAIVARKIKDDTWVHL